MFTQADMDFTMFVATRNPTRVRKEAFVETIRVTKQRMYDQETERQLAIIRHNERKAS